MENKKVMDSVIELASDYAILDRGVSELLLAMSRRSMDVNLKTGHFALDECFVELKKILEKNNDLREEIKKMKEGPVPKPNLSSKLNRGKGYDYETFNIQDESGEIIATIRLE